MEIQHALMAAAFEAVPIGMMILVMDDPDDLGSFYPAAANAAACETLQQDIKADIGKTWNETSPDLVRSDFPKMYRDSLLSGKPVSWELEYGDRRFDKNWWRGTGMPIDARTLVIVFENVTAEKERELDLERSNRALDDFAYVASHDLRAPLRDIANLAKWLGEDMPDLPEAPAKHLDTLQNRVGRMDRLLDDLLAYSRAGRVFAEAQHFSLAAALDEACNMVPTRDGIEVYIPPVDIELNAPRVPLEVVLRNLLSNAIKHHDREQGRVEVSVVEHADHVAIAVRDDGPGIAERYHQRVFDMFQTLRPRDELEGSGMGLALARKLVRAYGEEMTLESELGRGSVFSFSWPKAWRRRAQS